MKMTVTKGLGKRSPFFKPFNIEDYLPGGLPPKSKAWVKREAKKAQARADIVSKVLTVLVKAGTHGIGVGALGHTISYMEGKAKLHAFPQAFAAYGYRLIEMLQSGTTERFHENGATRFRLAGKV
jgi:hypothetical protein